MNIVLINADSIFWEADKNIRTVDFKNLMAKIDEISVPDQIYLVGGLEATDPFNESLKDILRENAGKPIIPVSSITKVSNRHNPEFVLMDLLYRGVLSQTQPQSNNFVVVSAEASSVRSASFLAGNKLIKPVEYILPDCIENMDLISQKVVVRDTFSLKPENKGVVERVAIKAIRDIIHRDSAKEQPFLNTAAFLIRKCKDSYGLSPTIIRPFLLSLIHNGYLVRQKFTVNAKEGLVQRTGILFGEKNMAELLPPSAAKF